ncbi:caspase domain-containing protein [Jatrophihabitans sp. GAS493]|uniref:caspase family protein n=1 Tax=Jatrophihabitans sp. GAS493 TaxID=1907575 RepID=UPI000BB918B6|nr:caspase family protein [Jatrophihabitans sp. GAS493]SOD71037.1 caspase domain-containing protein [Jatrophihabitans sp. GAS493]
MAGRYRALLIGNSTYPADEHNLQTLKGPVKDIAALNRALVDRTTGLFADVDVTLLPEATSARVIRALGTFFDSASRDDVLLLYFSGHGKLDQSGRLHLCVQDTESGQLLSTAVSSARINEFAEASRAQNTVIILDCCYAGAFRGGDLGESVAGPGRYVLSSCRGTQLANDATIDNGTSAFTQHLIDGLLDADLDQNDDGFITFTDLYTYVDEQLRREGKQIPQRRVDGDGDVRLARRSERERVNPPSSPAQTPPAERPDARPETIQTRRRPNRPLLIGAGAVVFAAVIGVVIALTNGGSGSGGSGSNGGQTPLPSLNPGSGSYTATAPWRLRVTDDIQANDVGCTLRLTNSTTHEVVSLPITYQRITKQVSETGPFTWETTDRGCVVAALAGAGSAVLPFTQTDDLDTDSFAAPATVLVEIKDFQDSSECTFRLYNPVDGQEISVAKAPAGTKSVTLDPLGRSTVYLNKDDCAVQISAKT